jgi:peptide-methionine (S)-S-oxide reductase
MNKSILKYIENIPEGYSQGKFSGSTYGITKAKYNSGRSFKMYAEELGGTNFVSLNYYITKEKDFLKPCEMSVAKVMEFLENVSLFELKLK